MMRLELLDLCDRPRDTEATFLTLTIARRMRGRRVLIFRGRMRGGALYGHVIGESQTGDGKALTIVQCKIADVRRWFRNHLAEVERMAVSLAEEDKHEESAEWMAQYRAIEQRLSAAATEPTMKGTDA